MKRESVNPWDWGLKWSMDQGQIVEGATRHLHCSGQVALKPDPEAEHGVSVVSPGDIRGQMESSLANIDAVLAKANRAARTSLACDSLRPTSMDFSPTTTSTRIGLQRREPDRLSRCSESSDLFFPSSWSRSKPRRRHRADYGGQHDQRCAFDHLQQEF